jgi:hypothetical protein
METFQTPRSSFLTWIEILSSPLAVVRISRYTPKNVWSMWAQYFSNFILVLRSHGVSSVPSFEAMMPCFTKAHSGMCLIGLTSSSCVFDVTGLSEHLCLSRVVPLKTSNDKNIFSRDMVSMSTFYCNTFTYGHIFWGRSSREPKPAGGCIAYSDLSDNFQDIPANGYHEQGQRTHSCGEVNHPGDNYVDG